MGVRKVKLACGAFISWILEFEIRAKTKKREIWDNHKFITLVLRVQYLKGQQIDDISSYILSALLIWQCSLAHPSTIPHHVVGITKTLQGSDWPMLLLSSHWFWKRKTTGESKSASFDNKRNILAQKETEEPFNSSIWKPFCYKLGRSCPQKVC